MRLDKARSRTLLSYIYAGMIVGGILNPNLLSLLARVRHTNTLVIADRGFPFWPGLETIDLSLVDGVPTVLQVLSAVRQNHVVLQAFMAEEFLRVNTTSTRDALTAACGGVNITYEPHDLFKQRVPRAVGLVRTGDTVQYANMILVSG